MIIVTLFSARKHPHPPHGRSQETPRGEGVLMVKIVEDKNEAKLEVPLGMGGAKHKTQRGVVWIFFL